MTTTTNTYQGQQSGQVFELKQLSRSDRYSGRYALDLAGDRTDSRVSYIDWWTETSGKRFFRVSGFYGRESILSAIRDLTGEAVTNLS